ncbi:hypothetical protein FACS1894208_08290 [Clostridia bacterium]|nr:hypothetical protein FACS1894208_08290 [Clostridia bacterium]
MADTAQIKEITEKLENGVKELFESDKYAEYLRTMSKFHRYSTRNTLLIHLQKPDSTRVCGYSAWNKQFNRQVKKGEHGIKIYAPIPFKDTKEFEKLDPVTRQPVFDENGNPIFETLERTGARFKIVTVFDISQTFGEELPELAETLNGSVERYDLFMDALRAVSPLPIVFEQMDGDGYCKFGDKIALREGMSEVQTISAAIHELTHARLHDIDSLAVGEQPQDKHTAEVTAESVSFCVASAFGVDTSANAWGYIAEWSKSRELKELNASLDIIRKTSSELIESIGNKYRELAKERGIDLSVVTDELGAEQNYNMIDGIINNEPVQPEQQPQQPEPEQPEPKRREYTELQEKGFAIAARNAYLPLQERLNIIAGVFNSKTASIGTRLCTGKWRGSTDVSIVFDNGNKLYIGTRSTPNTKKKAVINELVNNTLARYNPEIVAEAKERAIAPLLKRQEQDNAIAAEKGLKPYKLLTVELNDGEISDNYLGWYYITLEVDGKIFGMLETGLYHDIANGTVSETLSRENYFVAGGLKNEDADFVFNNVGHSSDKELYKVLLGTEARNRAEIALYGEVRSKEPVLPNQEEKEQPKPVKPDFDNSLDEMEWQIVNGEKFDTIRNNYHDHNLDKHPLFTLFERHGVEIPLATKGWVNRNLRAVQVKSNGSCTMWLPKGVKASEAFVRALTQLKDAIISKSPQTREIEPKGGAITKTMENKLYDKFADMFPEVASSEYNYLKLEANGRGADSAYEPLSLEYIGDNRISVMHTYTMNGDLMYDPMIEFEIDREAKTLSAVSFEQSMPPLYQVKQEDGKWLSVDGNGNQRTDENLQNKINSFAVKWFDNIDEQHYLPVRATLSDREENAEVIFTADGKPIVQEPEPPPEPEYPMPDPSVKLEEVCEYGYTADEILPLSQEKALELYDQDHTIYLLYEDNTEAIAFDREEVENFGGYFGIERDEWENIVDFDRMKEATRNSEGSREADLLFSGTSKFGIYQLPSGVDELHNLRFANMSELEKMSVAPERNNYQLVYTGELDIRDTQTNLHKIYDDFNINHPEDFKGHSVSVSDVIVLQWRGDVSSHYVDSVGFKELPHFIGEETTLRQKQPQVEAQEEKSEQPKPDIFLQVAKSSPEQNKQPPMAKGKPDFLGKLRATHERLSKDNSRNEPKLPTRGGANDDRDIHG